MTTPPPAPQPVPQPAAPQPAAPLTEAEDKQWASFAHFGGAVIIITALVGFAGVGGVLQAFIALLAVVPALVIFLVFGKRGARTLVESKEALNFIITAVAALIIWIIISTIIVYVALQAIITAYLSDPANYLTGDPTAGIYALYVGLGIPTLAIAGLAATFSIIGGVKVQAGGSYRYPFAIRLIK
jgi:uncharacterized protein